ncbi:hypothetical protein [Halorussus marinus]|uniref:hypothetical protein n=1 Tax=Halorussus marinus TaxID=2505976 RepID=UPI00143D88B3|nr:hypothetical protein [Halorussus marinus]
MTERAPDADDVVTHADVETADPNRTPVAAAIAGSGPEHLAETLDGLDALDGVAVED